MDGGTSTSISYTRGDVEAANDLGAWVYEDVSGGTNANHYGVGAITFNEPDQSKSAYANVLQELPHQLPR